VSAGLLGVPAGMVTESTAAGETPRFQLAPLAQSAETEPFQVRVIPVTSKIISPARAPAVAVMEQVPARTPVTVPPTVTVAQVGSEVPKVTVPGRTSPSGFLITAVSACGVVGCRFP
jgi:hypothetical protein